MTRAAVAKSDSRNSRNWPRTIRHGIVQVISPIMIIRLMMPGPRTDTAISSRMIVGKLMTMSTTRMMTRSARG